MKSSVDEVDSDHSLVDGVDGVDDDDDGEDEEEEGHAASNRAFHLERESKLSNVAEIMGVRRLFPREKKIVVR